MSNEHTFVIPYRGEFGGPAGDHGSLGMASARQGCDCGGLFCDRRPGCKAHGPATTERHTYTAVFEFEGEAPRVGAADGWKGGRLVAVQFSDVLAEVEQLTIERDDLRERAEHYASEAGAARTTAQYWKDEHLAANAEMERIAAQVAELNREVEAWRLRFGDDYEYRPDDGVVVMIPNN